MARKRKAVVALEGWAVILWERPTAEESADAEFVRECAWRGWMSLFSQLTGFARAFREMGESQAAEDADLLSDIAYERSLMVRM
jgi:hypothetical protein